jgi:hypothetical protein
MKRIIVAIIFISVTSYAFRLSRLTQNGTDVAKDAYYRWEKNTVTIGFGLDETYANSSTTCSTVTTQEAVVKNIIKTINDISESSLELKWGGTSGGYDIDIYSFSAAEWETHDGSWGMEDSNTLGFASTSARCSKSKVCHFTAATIRLNCAVIAQIEDDPSKPDFQSVLLHELIHALGLDHTSVQKNVMYYALDSGTALKRTLTTDDENGLVFLYPKSQGPNILKYLVCGQIVTPKNPSSRIIHILILTLGTIFLILLKKRKCARSDVLKQ